MFDNLKTKIHYFIKKNMLNEDEKNKALSQINSSIIRNFIKKFYLNEKLNAEDYKDIEHERVKTVEEINDNT